MIFMGISVAELSGAEAITGLINVAFSVERFFIDGPRTTLNSVQDLFASGKFLIAEDAGVIVGCVYVEMCGERGYLGLLSVDPSRQRSGLGSILVAAAEDHLLAHGCRYADLQIVHLREELPPFYSRLGYIENGTSAFPPEASAKRPCHFVKMSKALIPRAPGLQA